MEILFQDASILVINKPSGLPVLPDGWEENAPYLQQQVEAQFGPVWVVHRLDKVTSGVILFARSSDSHRYLNQQFEDRLVKKVYHAIVNGAPIWDDHTARHPLRINVGHSHRTMVDHRHGKPSQTHFHVLERFSDASLLEAFPATGRTHQVRVHAFALGMPLVGDVLYSAPPTDLIARPALHALSLSLAHPLSGEIMTFSADYPDDFKRALKILRDN
jgi:tRNA pseudouridine32 synthase / 23S rRNA pseudouridine746 synthase